MKGVLEKTYYAEQITGVFMGSQTNPPGALPLGAGPPPGPVPAGPPARRRGRPPVWFGRREELLRRVVDMRTGGTSHASIARMLGISRRTVGRLLQSIEDARQARAQIANHPPA